MAKSFRQERLNESIKELLSELLINEVKDPRIGLVTITSVNVAQDLTSAKVYFSVMGSDDARDDTRKGLESAQAYLRKKIGRELKLRSAPELRFVYDDSLDRSMAIEEALKAAKLKDGEDQGK